MLGRLLRGIHASDRHLAAHHPALRGTPATITLTSTAFSEGGRIALRCVAPALGGGGASPGLAWTNVPAEAAELVLIAQDPDAPLPRPVVHMIVTAIPPDWTHLPERIVPTGLPAPARPGRVSFRQTGYLPPTPPKGHGPHRYVFTLVAARHRLDLPGTPALRAVLRALAGNALARGQVIGICEA